jgi:hypothetical protein
MMTIEQYKPEILNIVNAKDASRFDELSKNNHIVFADTILNQLHQWIAINNPSARYTAEQLNEQVAIITNDISLKRYGNWVYYPWLNTIVHLLPEDKFIDVRTNRNRIKITAEEQKRLFSKKIGVIGLSVGQALTIAIATERIAGEIRIADHDDIELSNLNRIRAGVHNLGDSKAILAARLIAEIDPYMKVKVFPDGITDDNLDGFLQDENGTLDALVEVCDNLEIKVKSRLKARTLGIPVLMDTNDRGMIDIERFDKEQERPIFHGIVAEKELFHLELLHPVERLELLKRLVSFENTSAELKESMKQLGRSIITWPQLASSVFLGAGAACDILRKILLGRSIPSGRFYIDIDEIIKTG